LIAPTFKAASTADSPWAELVRLCRQICIDSERDPEKRSNSGLLFSRALSDVQSRFGATSVGEADLEKIIATEANRVADAAVTAELLLPKLVAALRTQMPTVISVPAATMPAPSPAATSGTTPQFPPPSPAEKGTPPPSRKSPRAAPMNVADLIDGMLDQDKNENRR